MKHKWIINSICFVIVNVLLFTYLQLVFIPNRLEEDGIIVAQMYNEPRDSIDVIIAGSSITRSAVLAPVFWADAGVTALNLSLPEMNAAAQYYLLREALRIQSPSVVIIQASLLFEELDFDGKYYEARFRQTLDHMRWSPVKYDAVRDITGRSNTQSFTDYLFPLVRYHSRRDLTREDFDISYRWERSLYMGSMRLSEEEYVALDRPAVLFESGVMPDVYPEYFDKMIALCRENGIPAILVEPPTCRERWMTTERHNALYDYADLHGLLLFDFNTPELYSAAGLDAARDFSNDNHTNVQGGTKVTSLLVQFLTDTYDLADRRNAPYDTHWDDVTERYNERMENLHSTFP